MTEQELVTAACAYSEKGQRLSQGVPLNGEERAGLVAVAKHYKVKPAQLVRVLILREIQAVSAELS